MYLKRNVVWDRQMRVRVINSSISKAEWIFQMISASCLFVCCALYLSYYFPKTFPPMVCCANQDPCSVLYLHLKFRIILGHSLDWILDYRVQCFWITIHHIEFIFYFYFFYKFILKLFKTTWNTYSSFSVIVTNISKYFV